ncbi:acyl-CoA carboxylase subunit epsilon [Streptomyces sp. NPDC059701]|uniref:acyl-CoA carboxylase subunit epsilon n=1 Tax=Streptomyces sp. NPDC059701 TaxID=3346914 RepID=UPI00368990F3
MGDTDRAHPALRIERGRATDEELAALTAVLLFALQGGAPRRAGWSRRPNGHRGPRSWQ